VDDPFSTRYYLSLHPEEPNRDDWHEVATERQPLEPGPIAFTLGGQNQKGTAGQNL
jgi:hypothetical protein